MFSTSRQRLRRSLLTLALYGFPLMAAHGTGLQWVDRFGHSGWDQTNGLALDGLGNVYATGFTPPYDGYCCYNPAGRAYFVRKYSEQGSLLWARPFGTIATGIDVFADASGNAYAVGDTTLPLAGPDSQVGKVDAFVSKLDDAGNLLWTRQLGSGRSASAGGGSVDGLGNVYIAGYTDGDLGGPNAGRYDAFLAKFDADGNHQWTHQFGTPEHDRILGFYGDVHGNLYATGYTNSSAFVSRFDADGVLLWTRQFDKAYPHNVSADALGNVFIVGSAYGAFGAENPTGESNIFVAAFDETGDSLWVDQFPGYEGAMDWTDISADGLGGVFVAGFLRARTDIPDSGSFAFVRKYNGSANVVWERHLRLEYWTRAYAVAADGPDYVYIAGRTDERRGGLSDAFVARYFVPEPATLSLLGTALILAVFPRRRRPW